MRFDLSLQNFKTPLVDIFSPQIERKNVAKNSWLLFWLQKKSFEQFSRLKFIFENSKHREAGLKHKLKL